MVFQNRNHIFGYTSVSSTCYILVNEQPKQNNAFSSLGFWENAGNDMDILEKCFERISDRTLLKYLFLEEQITEQHSQLGIERSGHANIHTRNSFQHLCIEMQ